MSKCINKIAGYDSKIRAPRMLYDIDRALSEASLKEKEFADTKTKSGVDRGIIKDLPYVLLDQLQVIAADDGIKYYKYSNEDIIKEARYVKELYDGNIGGMQQDTLAGEYGASDKKEAQKEYREIKKFLKKYG